MTCSCSARVQLCGRSGPCPGPGKNKQRETFSQFYMHQQKHRASTNLVPVSYYVWPPDPFTVNEMISYAGVDQMSWAVHTFALSFVRVRVLECRYCIHATSLIKATAFLRQPLLRLFG